MTYKDNCYNYLFVHSLLLNLVVQDNQDHLCDMYIVIPIMYQILDICSYVCRYMPIIPRGPRSPASPLGPKRPVSPLSPFNPISPLLPGGPLGPGLPSLH